MSLIKSKTTGLTYNDDTVLYFKNAKQSVNYVLWGATLLDLIPDENDKKFLFVFSFEDHKKYRERWKNHED